MAETCPATTEQGVGARGEEVQLCPPKPYTVSAQSLCGFIRSAWLTCIRGQKHESSKGALGRVALRIPGSS